MSEVSITALAPQGMVTVRGDLKMLAGAVRTVTGCDVPARRMSVRGATFDVLWMAPDEALILSDYAAAPGLAADLTEAFGDAFATACVVSDARQVFEIAGDASEDLLAKLMPVDFARLEAAEVRRTRMAQVPAALWRRDGGFRLMCFRSVADYARTLLETARPVGG